MAMAALRTCLTRMLLPQDAATYATDVMGLNSLDAWRDYQDDDDLQGITKNMRSPGGTTQNAAGNEVRHPGFPVSITAIGNLKIMRLALKHHQHIQREVAPATITAAWISEWEFLVDYYKETSKKKPTDETLPKIVMNDWAKTKEKIITHFTGVYGKQGIPLAYILRETEDVEPEADDPPENYDDDHIQELIARAPHDGATYREDNRTMCRMLKKICEDTAAYTYVSKYSADGRQAWLDLLQYYCGPQHTQNQAAIYEAKMQNTVYEGESSRFGYDKYAEIHKTSHTHLEALKSDDYTPPAEGTKIRFFINGIKNEKLKTVVELVRANPDYATFDDVARRIKDSVINLKPTKTPTRQVASVSVKNAKGQEVFADVEADLSVEDKYYPPKEWAKLSSAKKKGVLHKRNKRGGARPNGKQKPHGAGKRKISKMEKTIKSLQRRVASLDVADADDDDASSSESEEEQSSKKKQKKSPTSNRNHPDLNRSRRGNRV
jgi:hypothetical protein